MAPNKKYYFVTGLFCLLGLMVLAAIFFKERIAFCDTAYQAVYLMIEHKPFMIWIRPGAILPQIIPLTAIWLHASLKTVMILHSLSFLIFFMVIYLLAYRYSDKKLLFFVIPLYQVLITNEVFYWPQSELQQGMLWLCLYAVLLFENKWSGLNQWLQWGIHFFFILWIQFFHPLLFFPIAFLLVYYYDSESKLFTRKSLLHLSACVIAFGIRNMAGIFNKYEKGKLNIGASIKYNLPHFFDLNSVHSFYHKIFGAYLIYILFVSFGMIWLLLNRKYLKAAVLASFSLGYWILIMISLPEDARFYTENMLLPLGFIVALPIVAEIIPAFRMLRSPIPFLLIIAIRLVGIYSAHTDYTAHYEVYEPYFDYVSKNKLNGVFVESKLVDQKKAISTWASGYETILTSSMKSPDSTVVVEIDSNADRFDWSWGYDTTLLTVYAGWGESRLPKQYFRLQHGKYKVLTKLP